MHEVSLCEGIVSIVLAAARANDFVRAKAIRLEIGPLSHVDERALRFAFPSVAHGTPAEGAELIIEVPPATAFCADCGETVTITERGGDCPSCGGGKLLVQSGGEMRVKDLEVA
ncbi:MAG: hydrogenase maturation nickel metallochaperone HypA [Rhizobiaceae bacterium]|jgi:hydrogenase nickel incorporation protein HypA/HybF|nr:hydrogenase maturation nickel metallochaperone HypA [Rhizobiaceae bacterium]